MENANISNGTADPNEDTNLKTMFTDKFFNPYVYFYRQFAKFPHRHWVRDVDKKELLDALLPQFDLDKKKLFETRIHDSGDKNNSEHLGAYLLDDYLLLTFQPGEKESGIDVHLYYSDDVPNKKVADILLTIKSCYKKGKKDKMDVRLLMQNKDDDLEFVPMSLKRTFTNIELNYNDDLLPINRLIVDRLNKDNDKGLVILYGKAGTGKTTYLRFLAGSIQKQKLFVPASLSKKIGSAEFLALLRDYKNSVLFIEDAEWLLKKRSADDDQVLANLLTLSDGLLSDFFHIQIVCTFNNDIPLIEPALLRKGRLIAKYYFKELEVEKARRLSMYLGYKFVPTTEMILSDIFHIEESEYQQPFINSRHIGFR